MSVLSVLIKDLVERTTLADNTCFIAGTVDANKITFSNLVAAIKGKLGAAAQKSVANNLTTAAAGTSVLDAYQGKLLSDKIDSLNSTLAGAIHIKTYSMTLVANNYVQPFSMFGDGLIPDADIKKYGTPIAICAIQESSAPGAAAIRWNSNRSAWQYIACSNMAKTDVNITFMKLS